MWGAVESPRVSAQPSILPLAATRRPAASRDSRWRPIKRAKLSLNLDQRRRPQQRSIDDAVFSIIRVVSIRWKTFSVSGTSTRLKFPRTLLPCTSLHSPWSISTSMAVWPSVVVEKTRLCIVGMVVLACDQFRHSTAESPDAERERGDVEKEDVRNVASEDTGLDGRADCNGLVGVDALAGLAAEDFLDGVDDDKDDFVNLVRLETGIRQRLLARLDERLDMALELRLHHLEVDVRRARRVGADEGQVDFSLRGAGQLNLALLGGGGGGGGVREASFLNSQRMWLTRITSKSSPPRWASPLVDLTSNTRISRMEISNVPPPRSYTVTTDESVRSRPYANAAAVGSGMTRKMTRPATAPASFIACLCASLK